MSVHKDMHHPHPDNERANRLLKKEGPKACLDFLLSKTGEHFSAPAMVRATFSRIIGACYSDLGDYPNAEKYLKLAINTLPYNYPATIELGRSYIHCGQLPKAKETLDRLHEDKRIKSPDLLREILKLRAKCAKLNGDYQESKELYTEYRKGLRSITSSIDHDLDFVTRHAALGRYETNGVEGTLDFAFFLRRQKRDGADRALMAINFLKNRLEDLHHPNGIIEVLATIAQFHSENHEPNLAKAYNQAAIDMDGNNARALATRLRLMINTSPPTEIRAQFNTDHPIIMRDPQVACALARTFHLAGFDALTQHIANDLLENSTTPRNVKESAVILLRSKPVAP